MGSLPHGWSDQTDARNGGKYDRWLEVKVTHQKEYLGMPLTMGFGERADFPFYYSLADAFTVCDQSFCSSITGTHPNRHYWMTGTVREDPADPASLAHLWNITNYNTPELDWMTYPERLDANGVSWKVYQNELTMGFGLQDEEWLSNFGTNVLEYFKRYNIRLHPGRIANLQVKKQNIQQVIAGLTGATDDASQRKLAAAQKVLANIEADIARYTTSAYEALSASERSLNSKAFSVNSGDPDYHSVSSLEYDDNGTTRKMTIPKGDILHQFREDVEKGRLPTVSWIMPPANLSDHPSVPWFGPAYVSEIMEILLKNPEVWKKTIFVLTYDENDGYYDHVPPFVVPNPYKEHTGKVSAGIDPKLDFVTNEQQTNPSATADRLREAPIGLGYRIPSVIVSPWTRGGWVCSEVFDHTSSLQFVETFLARKTGKTVKEENITQWRRTICGDLTSAFRPYDGEEITKPEYIAKNFFLENIDQARFRNVPANFARLTAEDIAQINADPLSSTYFPRQEKGIRPACALPYELYADGRFDSGRFVIGLRSGNGLFGQRAAGAPFTIYGITAYQGEAFRSWNYAVAAGDQLEDEWDVAAFEGGRYYLRVYGPNGFYREFRGSVDNPALVTSLTYEQVRGKYTGNVVLRLDNRGTNNYKVTITDKGYGKGSLVQGVGPGNVANIVMKLDKSHHWYDLSIAVAGFDHYEERFAGKAETGEAGMTDPLMGGVV
jgi:phospholipase C